MRHAECPVVVTRHSPSTQKAGVLVGADGTAESRLVLEFAFRMASLRALPLTVMHTAFGTDVPDDPVGGAVDTAEPADLRLVLAESVAGYSEKYPDVRVVRRLAHGLTDEGLLKGKQSWDLVVVGRHPRRAFLDSLEGAVSTSVLEQSRGAVAMVPEPASTSRR
jgi:nucleotide-binding universal stress UspA family protein